MAFQFTNAQKAFNDTFPNKYVNTLEGSQGSISKRIELSSDIDTTWFRWKERSYHFGFNPSQTPIYSNVNGILSTSYMFQVRGSSSILAKHYITFKIGSYKNEFICN
jgi:hypothetical protein